MTVARVSAHRTRGFITTALIRSRWTSGRHVWRICAKVRNLVILGAYGDRRAAVTTGYVPVPLRPRFLACLLGREQLRLGSA